MAVHRLRRLIALVALLATPVTLGAQTVSGSVLDDLTKAPIAAATVMLLDSMDTAIAWAESDSLGRFFMRVPTAGRYRLYADRLTYGEIFSEAFLLAGVGSVEVLLRMVPLPVELDGLVVTAERLRMKLEAEGFYRRRDYAPGYFFDAEYMETWRPTFVSDVLRNVPGVAIRRGSMGGARVVSRRQPNCPLKIVLDGFKVDTAGTDLDYLVDVHQIIGIEVYPGAGGMGAPVQHRGTDAFCGILMLWTR